MLKVFYGNDNKTIYSEISKMKSGYDHVAVFNEYTDPKSAASEMAMKNIFQDGRKLVILYNLSTNMKWIPDLLSNAKNDTILVFSSVDKRSKIWKLIKDGGPKEFKIKRTSIFEYIDKIFNGDIGYIFENYGDFEEEYEAIDKLVSLLFRHIYVILRVKRLSEKGYNNEDISNHININKYFISKYKRDANSSDYKFLVDSLGFLRWVKKNIRFKYTGGDIVFQDRTLVNVVILWFVGGHKNRLLWENLWI